MLAKTQDLEVRDALGHTALMLACLYKDGDSARLLLHKGAAINARDIVGSTALHYALRWYLSDLADRAPSGKDAQMVRLLLAQGANPNVKARDGYTPLKLAKEKGDKQILQMLQQAGAKE